MNILQKLCERPKTDLAPWLAVKLLHAKFYISKFGVKMGFVERVWKLHNNKP